MADNYQIGLSDIDLGQMLDGLDQRADAWEYTAESHRSGMSPIDIIVEEADQIAKHYRSIINKIELQLEVQR